MITRTLAAALWLTLAVTAVSAAPELQAQQSTAAPLYPGPLDSARLARLVDARLAGARRSFEAMLAVQGKRTAANTLRPWDDAMNRAMDASGLADIAVNVYPDSAVRQEGLRAVERVSKFRNEVTTDPRAARAFTAIDTTPLSPVERRLVALALRNFRRAGVLLPDAERARVRENLETLDRLSTAFARNIAEDTTNFAVDESELAGMPPDWIARHRRDSQKRVLLTLQYPDFFPVLNYAQNRALRQRMGNAFQNRGRSRNVIVLDSLLRVRQATARLLGYPTWAAYQAEPTMAGSADTIRSFIERVRQAAAPANARLMDRLLARLRQEDSSVGKLALWDAAYASELLRRSDYNLDSREVRAYFPFETVRNGILSVTAELFGVTIRPAKLPVWHRSVEAYEVLEKGRRLGRFYLDLHPRPAKYQHAAVFALRGGIAGRQLPEAMLVTSFPGGEPNEPGLMEWREVVTFFHEFGHLVHDMFARQPYATVQWPAEQDFIEAPSQMLEEFVQLPAVLARLSSHVKTRRPIPDSLVSRVVAADEFSRPRQAAFSAALSKMSFELHSHSPDSLNVDSVAYRALSDYTGLVVYIPTHFATSFDHIGSSGYAATYYTYLWSQVISKDLWTAFRPERPFDPAPARRYRDVVLRPGGGRHSAELVEQFLGRPFGFESWQRWLQGSTTPATP
jgi:thimet oligopeptidase